MYYKKFKTDDNDCIKVQTFSLSNDSEEILISQLITDGNIDAQNVAISKNIMGDINFDYLDDDVVEKIKQYQNEYISGFVKEVSVEHPSYCMFTVYRYTGKEWMLIGRTIIVNKTNRLFYDFSIIKNIPYLESGYMLGSKPSEILPNRKVLKRKKLSSR